MLMLMLMLMYTHTKVALYLHSTLSFQAQLQTNLVASILSYLTDSHTDMLYYRFRNLTHSLSSSSFRLLTAHALAPPC